MNLKAMLCSLVLMCGCSTTGQYLVYTKRSAEPPPEGICRDYRLIAALGDDAKLLGSALDGWLVIECELEKLEAQPNILKIKPLGEEPVNHLNIIVLYDKNTDHIQFPDGIEVDSLHPLDHLMLWKAPNGVDGALVKELGKLKWARCIEPTFPLTRAGK